MDFLKTWSVLWSGSLRRLYICPKRIAKTARSASSRALGTFSSEDPMTDRKLVMNVAEWHFLRK